MSGDNKKLLVVFLGIAVVAFFFWTGSRYPQLSEKALLGMDTPSMGISFDTIRDVQETDSWLKKAFNHTLNWLETNKKGMTFGILFGTLLMLAFSILKDKKSNNRWVNTLLGTLIGAPLGVCVNCAAPIAKGMKDAGARTETALATMISSPTLNVIVLSMLFSLLPPYMVWLKLGATALFILLVIPVLSKLFKSREKSFVGGSTNGLPSFLKAPEIQNEQASLLEPTWIESFKWVAINFFKSLWFLIRTTVPLMILAGFLGNVMITFLPLDGLGAYFQTLSTIEMLMYMVAIALLGTFLPVPMAFDVLIVATLWSAGLPAKYSMILLFTLGTFSIYSGFIVHKGFSFRLAAAIFLMVAAVGFLNGAAGHYLEKELTFKSQMSNYDRLKSSGSGPSYYTVENTDIQPKPFGQIKELLSEDPPDQVVWRGEDITVHALQFNSKVTQGKRWFTGIEGQEIGLEVPYHFSPMMVHEPFANQRSIATGDVHLDGYPDVLMASADRLFLYANIGGERFERQVLEVQEELQVFNAALVDLNNDGWLDVFFSTYLDGNHLILNNQGSFENSSVQKLPAPEDMVLTSSAAFGDINEDGLLDIVVGNWTLGALGATAYSIEAAQNFWLENKADGDFAMHLLGGHPGETLSTLLSDVIGDDDVDLLVGNDFSIPDYYHEGKRGAGTLDLVANPNALFERSTTTTMSAITADINNDLQLEIFEAQVDRGNQEFRTLETVNICSNIKDPEQRKHCEAIFEKQKTYLQAALKYSYQDIPDEDLNDAIAAQLVRKQKHMSSALEACQYFPEGWREFSFICNFEIDKSRRYNRFLENSLRVRQSGSVLLQKNGEGRFEDRSDELGVAVSGWAWNAKFADLDNDEYQDLYVANGYLIKPIQETNIFYHNIGGEAFADSTFTSGLQNFLPTSSYSYVDYDLDGDLDIIAATSVGPAFVYRNNSQGNHSIAIQLKDKQANTFGIGSKIIVRYGEGKHQLRELIAGGGYKSFDAPVAHFGLGEFEQIQSIEVQWSDGKKTIIDQEMSADRVYTINRK